MYRYPIEEATHIAFTVVKRFLESQEGDKVVGYFPLFIPIMLIFSVKKDRPHRIRCLL